MSHISSTPACYACARESEFDDLSVRERISVDEYWRVAHAVRTSLEGWLVLLPRRHVTAVADLTDAEAERLGTWQVRLSRALHTVTGCAKTYLAQFAEADGFTHVHVHVVPRAVDLSADLRGPHIFEHLHRPETEHITAARMDALAERLRRALMTTA